MEKTKPGKRLFRVLVVDDNRDAAESLATLIQLWGYVALVMNDGDEALETARRYRPDCMFLDLGLPGRDGFRVVQEFRQDGNFNRAKLVALTAYGGSEFRQRAREAGFDYYFVKPADPSELERLLAMLNQTMNLATRTEQMAQENLGLAQETRELIGQAREDLQEVKEDIKEVKDEIKEIKEEFREVKEAMQENNSPASLN